MPRLTRIESSLLIGNFKYHYSDLYILNYYIPPFIYDMTLFLCLKYLILKFNMLTQVHCSLQSISTNEVSGSH